MRIVWSIWLNPPVKNYAFPNSIFVIAESPDFESQSECSTIGQTWPYRLTARTERSQRSNRGSIPRGATIHELDSFVFLM